MGFNSINVASVVVPPLVFTADLLVCIYGGRVSELYHISIFRRIEEIPTHGVYLSAGNG